MDEKQIIFDKKKYAQKLFFEGKTYSQVQKTLKKEFGTGFSNRDLQKLKASTFTPKIITCMFKAFKKCYSGLCNLSEKSIQAQEMVNEYADLFFDLEKERMYSALPKELWVNDLILTR